MELNDFKRDSNWQAIAIRQRREGSVWLKLNYSSRVASFSFSLKEKQNKINRAPPTDETQSSLHLLFAVGEKWKKLTLKHYSNCRRDSVNRFRCNFWNYRCSLTVLAGLSSDHTGSCVWGNIPNSWIFRTGESNQESELFYSNWLMAG